jgi:glucose-6-phosphate-specific signal transduction histidine kinase
MLRQREILWRRAGEFPDRRTAHGCVSLACGTVCSNVCTALVRERLPVTSLSERNRVWIDLAIVLVAAALCWWLASRLELIEWLFVHTRRLERFQVDELAIALVALAIGMTWFALRRYRDAKREVAKRIETQERLTESLAEQRRLAQRYVLLQEAERKALARELHDELGQYLNAIKIDAVALRDDTPTGEARRAGAGSIIANADHVYRTVGGLIRRLRPVGLDELGLAAALEHIVDGARARLPSTRFSLHVDGEIGALSETFDLTLYRLVQEGLTNCAKHASASEVDVRITRERVTSRDCIMLTMTDNGAGADWAARQDGLGLVGMRERVEALGGQLHITTAPGYGFRIVASLPLEEVKA